MFENRDVLAATPEHELALDCLSAGISAAHPKSVIEKTVRIDGEALKINGAEYNIDEYNRILVLGGGNAAGQAAAALEDCLGRRIEEGIVVTDDPATLSRVECIEGSHPIPNKAAEEGTRQILQSALTATKDDLIIALITGGGSALLPAPAESLELADLQTTTEELLRAGATIAEINTVRKHLSDIKGGKLVGAASPAKVVGLIFSDVTGNDIEAVASGPVSPDNTTYHDALDIVDRYDLAIPAAVQNHLTRGNEGEHQETLEESSGAFDDVDVHILADNFTALSAASDVARKEGHEPVILSSHIRGEASEVAKVHVGISEEVAATGNPVSPPAVLISGGETTVTVDGEGSGGPNQEFALSAALELDLPRTVVGSVDTDGIDGNVNAAGALIDADTIDDKPAAQRALSQNDVYSTLDATKALLKTGATGTNVNDLRVIVIGGPDAEA
ncbi:glycerate kinase type-2 family protein [Haloarcula nitratireducens]|uniref:DUF4147 domain-containing protein n=1 Tax=Haloarcula nitratireducens TaxID=2487749 RepID=A0AAW4PK74_9EURY|nr:DUF4147 domain-containing protein [Halomicroarcula nitratireducens]MBX0297695.1 DUF4147 domain-containing protein [Halomicroarcula nitratireducens]